MSSPVVLITGALSGIGRATALAYAKQGAKLIVSGRRADAGAQLEAELRKLGAEADFVTADVSREDDVRKLVEATVARFGRLDIAVNNAGNEGSGGPITGQTVENYKAIFDTNVLGVFLGLKYQLPVMLAQGSGSVVNISSIAGQIGLPGAALYVASKHAVDGLTKSAALEVAAAGVRVNSAAPGPVDTPMLDRVVGGDQAAKAGFIGTVPARRAASVDDVANLVLFLGGEQSRYVNGQSYLLDGGYTAG
jgi:NAD(P)-dependent dehydrogenase (short-subunit alcohol dehydrogenase family)